MRTHRICVAMLVAATVLLAGCQDSEPEAAQESPTASATSAPAEPTSDAPEPEPEESSTPAGTVVEIVIDGDSVKPSGARVRAGVGEPITLQVTSDRAGELHVHSTPEQELSFEEGTTSTELVIEQPGVVEVEDHDSGLVIVQLEVS